MRVIALEKRETCPRCSRFPVEKERDRRTPASSRALEFRGNAKREPASLPLCPFPSSPEIFVTIFYSFATEVSLYRCYEEPDRQDIFRALSAQTETIGFEAVGWRVAPLRVRRRASVNRVSMTLAADLSTRRATTPTATIASPSFPTSFNRLFPVKVARMHQNVSLRAKYDVRTTSSKLVRYTKLRARKNNQR